MSASAGRLRNLVAYFVSPKILIGGVLAYLVIEGVEAYKLYRTETRADVVEVRDRVLRLVVPKPKTPADAQRAIDEVTSLLLVYDAETARDLILRVIGSLSELRAALIDKEAKVATAREAERLALDAAARENGPAVATAEARAAAARAEEVAVSNRVDWLVRNLENWMNIHKRPL